MLYERGVEVSGHFARTPDELRQPLALPNAEFDAFLARNDEIRDWYLAWYAARD